MKTAVIGTGKTGSKVAELLDGDQLSGTFDSTRKPGVDDLVQAEIAIIFVPGEAVEETMDPLLKAGIPAVWGSTGYDWPDDLDRRLKDKGIKWLRASNFSLGMNIIRRCLRIVGEGSDFLENPAFHIHEIHHVHKQDAPSGTALSWQEWLGHDAEITSERKGDIKGIHDLHLKTKSESIWLKHQAHDRSVFAEGAVWAAHQLLKEDIGPGFHEFSTIFDRLMAEKTNKAES